MKRVAIKNTKGEITHGAESEDPTEWINEQVSLNSWGKPDRWVYEFDLETQGENAELAIDVVIEDDVVNGQRKKYRFAADYTIEVEDITEEVELEKRKKDEKQKKKKDRTTSLTTIKWKDVNTVAELKNIVQLLVDETLERD